MRDVGDEVAAHLLAAALLRHVGDQRESGIAEGHDPDREPPPVRHVQLTLVGDRLAGGTGLLRELGQAKRGERRRADRRRA
ncbi:MAG TPA: hypothetical protein VM841_15215 [Actinomycetota bacterium]|nr:hypothetical protein [Actinomycetota bacterium]